MTAVIFTSNISKMLWVRGARCVWGRRGVASFPGTPAPDHGQYETLKVTRDNGVRLITFNRPEKKNAINEKMFKETVVALAAAAGDPDTVVTATTGAGTIFTAGNDLNNFRTLTPSQIKDLLTEYFAAFIDFPKPLVAVINGAAVGAGLTTLALYDQVLASSKARFFAPFSSLGIVAEGCSTYTFPLYLGYAKTSDLIFFDQKVTAAQANKLGLVTEVFQHEALEGEAMARLNTMAALPVKSLVYSKALTRDVHRHALHKASERECARVSERFCARLCPDSQAYKDFVARECGGVS